MNEFTEQVITVFHRLDEIWYKLDIDDKYHQQLIDAASKENAAKFSLLLSEFEQYHRERVEIEIDRLRVITSHWPLSKKKQISERINQLEQLGMNRLKAIQVSYYELK
ncbi:MAG: hypothetical protein ABFD51_12095 [Anaerolineaceae bacterium]